MYTLDLGPVARLLGLSPEPLGQGAGHPSG
jgi:hypothetical protein